jgi:hypothetical protein
MAITFAATQKKFEKERMDYSAFCKDPLENFRKKHPSEVDNQGEFGSIHRVPQSMSQGYTKFTAPNSAAT